MSYQIIFKQTVIYMLIVIIANLALPTEALFGNSETCSLCVSMLPREEYVINTGDEFIPGLNKLSDTLYDLCDNLEAPHFPLERCYSEAEGFLIALQKQSGDHEFVISSIQMCGRISACLAECCSDDTPQQVHISLTEDPSQMVVMWVSSVISETAAVKFFQSGFGSDNQYSAQAMYSTYTSGGWEGSIYTALLTGLLPSTPYSYQVSNDGATYSETFQFISAPSLPQDLAKEEGKYFRRNLAEIARDDFSDESHFMTSPYPAPVIALYGDMDTSDNSQQTAESLSQLAANNSINLVIHAGDIGYADSDESVYDDYFNMIQGYASKVPYMTAPGNHENYYNFSAYYARLTMPVQQSFSPNKQFFSFNYQNIHFVSWSYEFDNGLDLLPGKEQYEWLKNDLETANNNRDAQPWIVLYGHRPLYCVTDSSDCGVDAIYVRELLEQLLNDYRVDVVIQAHTHNYQRSYPVYKQNVVSTSYENIEAPVYFVVGTGGKGKDDTFESPIPAWSASQVLKYGYMLMSSPDQYNLDIIFISKSFNLYDEVTISRTATFWESNYTKH